jgi:hypothetical protein
VPPSPALSAGLQHRDQAISTHITPISQIRGHHDLPFARTISAEPAGNVSATRQPVLETSPLPIDVDHGAAWNTAIPADYLPSDTIHDEAAPGSDRLTPEPGESVEGQYLGPSSAQSFLGKALRRVDGDSVQGPVTSGETNVEIETSTLSFGDAKVKQPDIAQFAWPEYRTATRLLEQFFEFASPTYRYMHEPTQHHWLEKIYNKTDVPVAAQACILLMFASASVFTVNRYGDIIDADHQGWESSEMYYQKAEILLSGETGPPRLESVQARFAAVQYLLSSSRPNKALFTFGTMVQLMQMVGIHRYQRERTGVSGRDSITVEIHRRLFWCAFTLDRYLSIVMGRLPSLRADDSNQSLPTVVNDEDLTPDGIRSHKSAHGPDSLLHATRAHVEIGMILAKASQEQNCLPTTTGRAHVEAAVRGCQKIHDWYSILIPILSGAVHPGSLIPCFRRQHDILTLARLHAVMFVTRPLLLRDLSNEVSGTDYQQYREQLRACIRAAREAVESINGSARHRVLYPAFWFSQYVAFSAISIIYIYIIQVSCHRITSRLFDPGSDEASLMQIKSLHELALVGQGCLAEAGANSAPVWRYGPILESLSAQTSRHIASQTNDPSFGTGPSLPQTTHRSSNNGVESIASHADQEAMNTADQLIIPPLEMDATWTSGYENLWDDLIAGNLEDNNLTMDFWPQFDNLPIGML